MKHRWAVAIAVVLMAFGQVASAENLSFDFSTYEGAAVMVDPTNSGSYVGSITFPQNGSGLDFEISNSNTGLDGYHGNIGGKFWVGPITSFGSIQSANLTPDSVETGFFKIVDPNGNWVQSPLSWSNMAIAGTIGGLNIEGEVNLGPWTASSSTPPTPLQSVLDGADWTTVLSFQILPKKTLTQLMGASTTFQTTYSGTLNAVPEPSTLAGLAGMGLMGLVCLWRRRK